MSPGSDIRLLRSFVRGETSWEVLTEVGAQLTFDPQLQLHELADALVLEPSMEDFATGLISNYAVGTSLREWASVVLATGMIDLTALEDDPQGQLLLSAIWDAAGGDDIADEALEVARQLSAD